MSGAPLGAPARPTTLAPAALVKAMTVSEPWNDEPIPGCAVTLTEDSVPSARADQISAVPSCVLARSRSVQLRPAPVTVAACPPLVGPSKATKATSKSLGTAVEKTGVVSDPAPSRETTTSWPIRLAGWLLFTLTVTGTELPTFPPESVADAEMVCWPSGTVVLSQEIM